ncbi:MurR/RpiR family transcriptional regulator [Enterococcus raffinosus]|uniref:MurR/RpiR family transcriptional regulator n=1 Tax=Enterococcus raffinosus TaxID=71452 RepID=UPI0021B4AC4D|nr:MurR/RpiR family transcriptional regulator [Enterococcus raffinosus]UXC26464.1 MurR/RpiR family transcriptional regulator [Enterococcus raffinosus]
MFNIYELLNYLNRHNSDKTYSKIIAYLFTHQEEIQKLTISQIAEQCFVSPATMARFCQTFGFSSFSHLREALDTNERMKSYNSLRMKKADFQQLQDQPETFLTNYAAEISAALQDILTNMDYGLVDCLLKKIRDAERVILIGYTTTLELARNMQVDFIASNKLTHVPENEALQKIAIQQADENTVILVLSSYGTILTSHVDLINQISKRPAHSVLITQHTQNLITNLFDQVLNLTSTNYVQIGNYPLEFFCDYFVRRYASLNEKRK